MVKEIVGTELGLTNNSLVHNRKTSSEMVGFFYVHPYYTDGPGENLFGNCQSIYSTCAVKKSFNKVLTNKFGWYYK